LADDGGWPIGTGEARTRAALDELRAVLGALEARLDAATAGALPVATAAELIRTLDVLARRMAAHEADAHTRAAELAATVGQLTRKLEAQAAAQTAREQAMSARLDLMLDELGRARDAAEAAPPPREPGVLRAALVAASALAAFSVVGAGVLVATQPELLPRVVAVLTDTLPLRPSLKPAAAHTASHAAGASATAPPSAAAPAVSGETYAAVAEALRRGDGMAIARLTGLAQAGDAQAQLHLASLYETGGAGLPRDVAAARGWTAQAAGRGDRMAMHNLGLFLMQGEGGPRDYAAAAGWFRRAAERGVVDSQYNLGLLYEAGRGVEKNLREAYRWYAIAANAGDMAAREKQVDLEGRLTAAERASLDRDAGSFQPGAAEAPPPDLAQVIAPATTIAETQALLARQGYYVGPIDGVATPAFRQASAAYLSDHPQP
jgi:localization factor PodJL